ncbi:MAG TPA: hypothetical protein VNW06_10485, partial [Cytophagaceae bacterium]|nr:hypothetical protein [Cytophagaceae bacterium]
QKYIPYIFIFLIYSSLFIFSYTTTELPSYPKIPLMDGNQYLSMWNYFKHHGTDMNYSVGFPFNGRILYIWIASLFPDSIEPIQIFILLNFFFGISTILFLLYIWNKLSLPIYQSLFLLVYVCIHWSGIIRQYMIDPVGVDIPYLLCITIFMYLVLFEKYTYLFALAIIGTAIKEAILPFLLFLLIYKLFQKKNIQIEDRKLRFTFSNIDPTILKITGALIAGVLCKISINFYFPSVQTGYKMSSIGTVLKITYQLLKEPIHILNWFIGIVLFFGVLVFPFLKGLTDRKNWNGKNGELLIYTTLGIVLAIIGGGDHTRIAFLSFPFFFTFILLYWKNNINSFSWLLYLVPSIYFTKCWIKLPTATVDWEKFSQWYPEYSSYRLFPIEIIVFITSMALLYLYNKQKSKPVTIKN